MLDAAGRAGAVADGRGGGARRRGAGLLAGPAPARRARSSNRAEPRSPPSRRRRRLDRGPEGNRRRGARPGTPEPARRTGRASCRSRRASARPRTKRRNSAGLSCRHPRRPFGGAHARYRGRRGERVDLLQRLSADAGGELVCDIGLVACALHVAETGSAFPIHPKIEDDSVFPIRIHPRRDFI